jgi:hypothetical protein
MRGGHPRAWHRTGMPGLRRVLIGAHQFVFHPLALTWAWRVLSGPSRDPRLHLTPTMEGEAGERHAPLGTRLVARLCGRPATRQAMTRTARTHAGALTPEPGGGS